MKHKNILQDVIKKIKTKSNMVCNLPVYVKIVIYSFYPSFKLKWVLKH